MSNNKLQDDVQELVTLIKNKEENERAKKAKRQETIAALLIVLCGVTSGTILGQLIIRIL